MASKKQTSLLAFFGGGARQAGGGSGSSVPLLVGAGTKRKLNHRPASPAHTAVPQQAKEQREVDDEDDESPAWPPIGAEPGSSVAVEEPPHKQTRLMKPTPVLSSLLYIVSICWCC